MSGVSVSRLDASFIVLIGVQTIHSIEGRMELVNGVVHPKWSLLEMRYMPGVITAPASPTS